MRRAVWLHRHGGLSLRQVREQLAERGVQVSHETVRRWAVRFGDRIESGGHGETAAARRYCTISESQVLVGDRSMHLWCALSGEGDVLDFLVQSVRDRSAALRMLRRLLMRQGLVIVPASISKWRDAGRRDQSSGHKLPSRSSRRRWERSALPAVWRPGHVAYACRLISVR